MKDETPPLVSAEDWANTPPEVRRVFLTLADLVRDLSAQVQELRAQLKQSSHTSSKPPSSDPPSAPPRPSTERVPRGRKPGAQPGHKDQQRPLLPEEQLDAIVPLHPAICPACLTGLAPDLPPCDRPTLYQIYELPPFRPIVTEYRQFTVCCPSCQHHVTAPLPDDVPPGAFGPRLTALVALLRGGYHLSLRATAALLDDAFGVAISLGAVATCCARVSEALAPLDTAIGHEVQRQDCVWVDETGWRQDNIHHWLWVGVSPTATCFRIHRSRGRVGLHHLLGESYGGVVHSDRANVYHVIRDERRQLCWAHIIRNFRGLAEHEHIESRWARAMLRQSEEVFAAWRGYEAGLYDLVALQQALLPVRLALGELLRGGERQKWNKLHALCRDLLQHWEGLWLFSREEGVEPTNNRAERALRGAVVWRKSCYGTQSEGGSRFVERLLSVQATAKQGGRNLFGLLQEAVRAHWSWQPAPVLFPMP